MEMYKEKIPLSKLNILELFCFLRKLFVNILEQNMHWGEDDNDNQIFFFKKKVRTNIQLMPGLFYCEKIMAAFVCLLLALSFVLILFFPFLYSFLGPIGNFVAGFRPLSPPKAPDFLRRLFSSIFKNSVK
jgi:hypothetical protein